MFTSLFLKMLNWHASAAKHKPKRVIESLQIREGFEIADIGSGGGYFTLKFAEIGGKKGRVYAVDIEPKYLNFVRRQAARLGLDNIVFILAKDDEMNLPEAGLDLVFVRNVFHHLPEPEKYFKNLKRFLKPGGKVAIIEYKPKGGLSFVALFKHYTSAEVILQRMKNAGYIAAQSFDFLPQQTFTLFRLA